VPSADFKATNLNKVLFPIKIAKPLIPLIEQRSKQNEKGIFEKQKGRPVKGATHVEVKGTSELRISRPIQAGAANQSGR
jgi:hypothetical protein